MVASIERRKEQRIPLDSLYFLDIIFNTSGLVTCMVLDVSNSGLMVELPPALSSNPPALGEIGIIEGGDGSDLASFFPNEFNLKVMWAKEGLCGLAFETSIEGLVDSLLSLTSC